MRWQDCIVKTFSTFEIPKLREDQTLSSPQQYYWRIFPSQKPSILILAILMSMLAISEEYSQIRPDLWFPYNDSHLMLYYRSATHANGNHEMPNEYRNFINKKKMTWMQTIYSQCFVVFSLKIASTHFTKLPTALGSKEFTDFFLFFTVYGLLLCYDMLYIIAFHL